MVDMAMRQDSVEGLELTEKLVLARTRAPDLESVRKLNCWASNINDVTVVRRMPNLEVCSLSINRLSTLRDFSHCPKLKELYVRTNKIYCLGDIHYLKNLPKLRSLWLSENPCADSENYRLTVLKTLPYLQKLDNTAVTPEEVQEALSSVDEITIPQDFSHSSVFHSVLTDSSVSSRVSSVDYGLIRRSSVDDNVSKEGLPVVARRKRDERRQRKSAEEALARKSAEEESSRKSSEEEASVRTSSEEEKEDRNNSHNKEKKYNSSDDGGSVNNGKTVLDGKKGKNTDTNNTKGIKSVDESCSKLSVSSRSSNICCLSDSCGSSIGSNEKTEDDGYGGQMENDEYSGGNLSNGKENSNLNMNNNNDSESKYCNDPQVENIQTKRDETDLVDICSQNDQLLLEDMTVENKKEGDSMLDKIRLNDSLAIDDMGDNHDSIELDDLIIEVVEENQDFVSNARNDNPIDLTSKDSNLEEECDAQSTLFKGINEVEGAGSIPFPRLASLSEESEVKPVSATASVNSEGVCGDENGKDIRSSKSVDWEEYNRMRQDLGMRPMEKVSSSRPISSEVTRVRNANILQAVLSLVKELDKDSLDIVASAIKSRRENF